MKKSFKIYIVCLFFVSICLYHMLIGFYDGFKYGAEQENITITWGTWEDNAFYIIASIVLGLFFYSRIKRKIVYPIEKLNQNMLKVSQGNLNVQIPVEAEFEFRQMEENFNFMTEQLCKAKEERQNQEQTNQQLYSSIAHDLKTPMTMILGYANALSQNETIEKERKEEYLKVIVEQTSHVNHLLDELLAYTRLQNQVYQLKMEKQDIVETLRICIASGYREFEKRHMVLELEIAEEEIVFCYDNVEMKRVFTNLLQNILKHNPEGTICKIQLNHKIIKENQSKILQIVFADNGPKLDESLRENIFQPFVVCDYSRNTHNGSGLGLSISKSIINRHGGNIFYEDNWGEDYKAFVVELVV